MNSSKRSNVSTIRPTKVRVQQEGEEGTTSTLYCCMIMLLQHIVNHIDDMIGTYDIKSFDEPDRVYIKTTYKHASHPHCNPVHYNVILTISNSDSGTCSMILSLSYFDISHSSKDNYITNHFELFDDDMPYEILSHILSSCSKKDKSIPYGLQLTINKIIKSILTRKDTILTRIFDEIFDEVFTLDFNNIITGQKKSAVVVSPTEITTVDNFADRHIESFLFVLSHSNKTLSDRVTAFYDINGGGVIYLSYYCYYNNKYVTIRLFTKQQTQFYGRNVTTQTLFNVIVQTSPLYECYETCNMLLCGEEAEIISHSILKFLKRNITSYNSYVAYVLRECFEDTSLMDEYNLRKLGKICKTSKDTGNEMINNEPDVYTSPSHNLQHLMIMYGLYVVDSPFQKFIKEEGTFYVKTIHTHILMKYQYACHKSKICEFVYQIVIPDNGYGLYLIDKTIDRYDEIRIDSYDINEEGETEISFVDQLTHYERMGIDIVLSSESW